jgi:hypothetical protein
MKQSSEESIELGVKYPIDSIVEINSLQNTSNIVLQHAYMRFSHHYRINPDSYLYSTRNVDKITEFLSLELEDMFGI